MKLVQLSGIRPLGLSPNHLAGKVVAIDAATGKEVSITGPVAADRATLEAAAIRKLQFVLNKQKATG